MNKDSKTDVIRTYNKGKITEAVGDRNHDGQLDEWYFYKNDMIVRGKSDYKSIYNSFEELIETKKLK